METVGTVTMYLEFVDEETKDAMLSVLSDAYDLHDFTHLLCNRVCEEEATDQLVFMAVHFAALFFDFTGLDRIAKAHGSLSIIRPDLFYGTALQGKPEDFEKVRSAADEVLASKPPDWLAMEMCLVKLEAENEEYPKKIHNSSVLDTIEGILEKQPEFDFYRSRIYDSLTIRAIRDGDTEQALELNQSAIDNAEKHNDINRLAHLLHTRASIIQSSNREESEALLIRSRDLMLQMGDKSGFADILFLLGKLESIRGDYNAAIDYNLECVKTWELIGVPIGMSAITLSTLYNMTGDADAGLEWARMAQEELSSKPILQPRAVLNQVWSLALQDKLTDAGELIDTIREEVLRSGLESNLGWLYFVSGILDMKREDYFSAATSIEESIDIYNRSRGFFSYYVCLFHRALVEIDSSKVGFTDYQTEHIGPWLTLLEEKARKENLPGILGQALLLKAHYFQDFDESVRVSEVVEELIDLVEREQLEFLKPSIARFQG